MTLPIANVLVIGWSLGQQKALRGAIVKGKIEKREMVPKKQKLEERSKMEWEEQFING